MEEYWRLMPGYQGVRLEDLQPLRILFGYFPTYRASPLPPAWDRILQARTRSRSRCAKLQRDRHMVWPSLYIHRQGGVGVWCAGSIGCGVIGRNNRLQGSSAAVACVPRVCLR